MGHLNGTWRPAQERRCASFSGSSLPPKCSTCLSSLDQFAYSHSLWSPDSSHLVVAGARQPPFSRGNGQTSTTNQVFVLDVADTTAPREIASGNLAFWSWN